MRQFWIYLESLVSIHYLADLKIQEIVFESSFWNNHRRIEFHICQLWLDGLASQMLKLKLKWGLHFRWLKRYNYRDRLINPFQTHMIWIISRQCYVQPSEKLKKTYKRGASFRWSLGPHSAWGSKASTTILTTHPSL